MGADLVVHFLGHAAFLLRSEDGTRVLLDPWDNSEERHWFADPFPQIQCDVLAMSHGHSDHVGEHRVTVVHETVREPASVARGGIRVRAFADAHARGWGDNMIIAVEAGETRFVHLGDNRAEVPDELIEEIGAVDMLAVPIEDTRHLLEFEEVDRLVAAFRPGVVVPMHYGHPSISADTMALGPCDEWLAGQKRVRHLEGEISLDRKAFPEEPEVWVLEPMPGPSTGPVVNAEPG